MRKGSLRVGVAVVGLLALSAGSAPAAPTGTTAASSNTLISRGSGGTVLLPPINARYVTPATFHAYLRRGGVITARLWARHRYFFNIRRVNGGTLGGQVETFDSQLELEIVGEGPLAGWRRVIVVPARSETHTGPRTPGDQVQSFDTVMYRLEGAISGDPDFDSLHIIAGTGNGLPSPGHTTLTDRGDGTYLVDSTFNMSFRLEYQASASGALAGASEVVEATVAIKAEPDPGPTPAGSTSPTATAN